jgi:hypothetical protein
VEAIASTRPTAPRPRPCSPSKAPPRADLDRALDRERGVALHFRADAAFAKPELYELLEAEGNLLLTSGGRLAKPERSVRRALGAACNTPWACLLQRRSANSALRDRQWGVSV